MVPLRVSMQAPAGELSQTPCSTGRQFCPTIRRKGSRPGMAFMEMPSAGLIDAVLSLLSAAEAAPRPAGSLVFPTETDS